MRIMLSFTALLVSIVVYLGVASAGEKGKLNQVELGNGEIITNNGSYKKEDTNSDKADKNNEDVADSDDSDIDNSAGSSDSDSAPASSGAIINTETKKHKIVVIDAGHGGYDAGSIGPSGSYEKENTLSVALKLGRILESKGIKVVYTRKSDSVIWSNNVKSDLLSRAKIANDARTDIFISIHNNSTDYDYVKGTETYFSIGSTKGEKLAQYVQEAVVETAGTIDRGIRSEDFSVLRNVKAPSVLVELGYISNAEEEIILKDPDEEQKFAEGLADGICEYLKIK